MTYQTENSASTVSSVNYKANLRRENNYLSWNLLSKYRLLFFFHRMPWNGRSGQDLGLVFHPKLPFGVLSNNTLSPNPLGLTDSNAGVSDIHLPVCCFKLCTSCSGDVAESSTVLLYVGKTRDECRQNSSRVLQ